MRQEQTQHNLTVGDIEKPADDVNMADTSKDRYKIPPKKSAAKFGTI